MEPATTLTKAKKYLIIILTFSTLIRLILLSIPTEIWWDEAVYISIGKHLFSGGASGFIEYQRPLILPLLLGIAWKINIDPITAGRTLAIICSLATIYMTYLITKKIHNEKAGILAALILSITGYFIYFSTKILTDIPSILLILIATNELINKDLTRKNIITAGIMTALAFLTRFTSLPLIIAIFLGIIISTTKTRQKPKNIITNLATYLLSFSITLAPYLIYMQQKYNDPLFSISNAITNINETKIYYANSITDIAHQLILQNPLLILSILGIYFWAKTIDRKKLTILILLATSAIALYTIPINILRYTLILLPFLCITAGSGLCKLTEKPQLIKKLKQLNSPLIHITVLILLTLTGIIIINPYLQATTTTIESKQDIYTYPKTNNITGPIITTTPKIAAYIDNRITPLAWPGYAEKNYKNNKKDTELILINTCDLICLEHDTTCQKNKQEFITLVQQENKQIKQQTIDNCTYTIYKNPNYKKEHKPPKINPLWWDEAIYMGLAENLYHNRTYTFNFGNQEKFRPPIYPLTLAALFTITGPSETAPIHLNLLITILTAITTYFLAKELFSSKKISLTSAILAVTSQQYIFWTSKILTEPLAILLTTISLLIFTKITKNKKTTLYPLLGFILALAFLTRYPLSLLPIYFILWLLATDRNHIKENRKKIMQGLTIFLLTLTPWLYQSCIAYNNPLGAALYNIHQVNDLYEPGPKTYYLSNFYTHLPYLGPLFTLGILLSILGKNPKTKKEQYFLICWFAITLLLLSFTISQKFFRYFLIALPAIAIISAKTLNDIAGALTKKHANLFLVFLILTISIPSAQAGLTKAIQDKENSIILRQAADYIKTHSEPGNGIMSENYAPLHYYTKQHVVWYPKDTWAIDEFIKRDNISYIVVENSIYYPEYSKHYFDNNPGFTKEFEKNQGDYYIKLYKCTKE